MIGAILILAVTLVVGLILYLFDRIKYGDRVEEYPNSGGKEGQHAVADDAAMSDVENIAVTEPGGGECCGMHAVCEKQLLTPVSDEPVYYDDEELDRFKGIAPDSYSPEEIEEFRDVLLTLLPQDVAGWAVSMSIRGIELPADVRDELLMIVSEQRNSAR